MLLSVDRTNFPLLAVEAVGVEAHLLPITKAQFELFMVETDQVSKLNYLAMLALNPAALPDKFSLAEQERLFITGLWPDEALAFARWLARALTCPPWPSGEPFMPPLNARRCRLIPQRGLTCCPPGGGYCGQINRTAALALYAGFVAAAGWAGGMGQARPNLAGRRRAPTRILSQSVGPADQRGQTPAPRRAPALFWLPPGAAREWYFGG